MRVQGKLRRQIRHFTAHLFLDGAVVQMRQHIRNPCRDFFHFRLAHPARGDRRASHANSAGFHRRQGIERDGIFIYGHSGAFESQLRVAPGNSARMHVHQHQMIFRPAGDNAESVLGQPRRQRARIRHHLLLIFRELRLGRLLQAYGLRGDDVFERPALYSWKSDAIHFLRVFFPAQHQTAARASQSFMRGGRNKIRVRHRARMDSRGHQTRDVRHIHKK